MLLINRFKRVFNIFKSSLGHPLNKNSKILFFFYFLFKFIKLHFQRRSTKEDLIVPWINSSKFILFRTDLPLLWNVYWGVAEYPDMIFLAHCLKKDNLFIDCGANVGTYSIIASKVVGANTIAFEPSPKTVIKLKQNIKINNIEEKIDIRAKILSDKKGTLYFSNFGGDKSVLNKVEQNQSSSEQNIMLPSNTLDDEVDINNDFILKIDVEGYEAKLIRGAKKILENEKLVALIIETNQMIEDYEGESREDLHNLITSYGLKPIDYDPFKRSISIKTKYIFDATSNKKNVSPNTIYIKNIDKIKNLVKNADKIKIHTCSFEGL